VYQCAGGLLCDPLRIRAITLTASGGPFRTRPLSTFDRISVAEACKHPTWDMGKKISIDSATLMNKGLEVIEAALLFNREAADIHVLIHPSSTLHATVEFVDGSVLAHLGPADMQVPIAHALGLPQRLQLAIPSLSLTHIGKLEFFEVENARYPSLALAYDALTAGQGACLALNAANEIAVAAFLSGAITFPEIVSLVDRTLCSVSVSDPQSIDDVFASDEAVRARATLLLAERVAVS
jgi:1-deoxy-D-xylulose-5-phosphate reductoisomerase